MVGVGLALCKLGREGGVLVDWCKFAKREHRAQINSAVL